MSIPGPPLLFALGNSRPLGERIAARLGVTLSAHEEREFGGGEHKARPLVEVGRRSVYVVHRLDGDATASANDKLVRLLFFVGALKDAGAADVTVIAPYLAYSRKDRRTKPRDPVTVRYVASLFEAVRTDRIVTLEVHNLSAFESAFRRCRPEHVPVAGLLADHYAPAIGDRPVAVVSPDAGGNKRAELFRTVLEQRLGRPVEKAIMDKHRSSGIVSGTLFAGNVDGRLAIIVDDLISSGGTIVRTTLACREAGASRVAAAAAHGLFSGDASALFGPEGPDEIVVTDSVSTPSFLDQAAAGKLVTVGTADLLGDIIGRIHRGEAVSDLIPYY